MTDIEIELDVPVPMRDGVVLRADIYRPSGPGPWPVLLGRTPYGKQSPTPPPQDLYTIQAVRRGYIVVHQDTRGRYESDGEWLPLAYEREDGHDTVEWAARLPKSNGRVGMFGASYNGSTQWSAAIAGAPSLRAIAPHMTWADPTDGVVRRQGAIEFGLDVMWSLATGIEQLPKVVPDALQFAERFGPIAKDIDDLAHRTYWELPAGRLPALMRSGFPDIGITRSLEYPEVPLDGGVVDRAEDVRVPSLNVGGWYDVFSQGTIDNFVAMSERGISSRLVMGPWSHSWLTSMTIGQIGEVNFGGAAIAPPDSFGNLTDHQLDWFDHWLRDQPVAASQASPVSIFVMGINQWRDEPAWPLERTAYVPWYLDGDGSTEEGTIAPTLPRGEDATSSFTYDPRDPVPTNGGAQFMASEFPAGPRDQRQVEARRDVLVFTSAPLTEDLEITGRVTAHLFAATDGPSTDWVVRLCDVDADGRSLNLVDGIARVDVEPDVVSGHQIDLWSTSIVVRAGHRLRVQVTSSNFPRWDRNLNTGESPLTAEAPRTAHQTIHHSPSLQSHLLLPVIPAG